MVIGVTEPRRIAATSMAARVAKEMNLKPGQVAYQVRENLESEIACKRVWEEKDEEKEENNVKQQLLQH